MTKEETLKLIDVHKNGLVDPVEMLKWTWLRLLIFNIPEDEWDCMMDNVAARMG